jgi:hypothetical protein
MAGGFGASCGFWSAVWSEQRSFQTVDAARSDEQKHRNIGWTMAPQHCSETRVSAFINFGKPKVSAQINNGEAN